MWSIDSDSLLHVHRLARWYPTDIFTVNGTKVRIPSYTVKTSDVIAVRQGSTGSALFTELDKKLKNTTTSDWLAFDITKLAATLKGYPKNPESSAGFSTVLEFYSR
jgi:small subunit ribosomal protein S4